MAEYNGVISRENTFYFDGRAGSIQETLIGPEVDTLGWGSGLLEVRFYGVAGTTWDTASRLSIVVRNVDSSRDAPLPAYSAEICVIRLAAPSAGTLSVAPIPDRLPIGRRVQVFLRWEQGPNANPVAGAVAAVLGIDLVGNEASRIIPSSAPGLALWLRGDVTTLNGSGNVQTWRDLSGNARDAANPGNIGSQMPALVESALNGKPALYFDGGDILGTPAFSLSTFTIFTVFNQLTGTTAGLTYQHSPDVNVNDGTYLYGSLNSTFYVRRGSTSSGKAYATNWATDSKYRIARHEYGGTHNSHLLFLNGAAIATTNTVIGDPGASNSTAQSLYFGANSGVLIPMTGNLAEVLVYSPALSQDVSRWIEREYLSPRYGISVA